LPYSLIPFLKDSVNHLRFFSFFFFLERKKLPFFFFFAVELFSIPPENQVRLPLFSLTSNSPHKTEPFIFSPKRSCVTLSSGPFFLVRNLLFLLFFFRSIMFLLPVVKSPYFILPLRPLLYCGPIPSLSPRLDLVLPSRAFPFPPFPFSSPSV